MSLKDRFSEELRYLRELGREFAEDDPRLAPFLGEQASDPGAAHLLEGFAFLTAKLALKIEDDLPQLTHPLLQEVYPNYLRPLPSLTQVRFDPVVHALSGPQVITKGTQLFARPLNDVSCTFRTCTDVTIYPLQVSAASVAHSVQKSVLSIVLQALSEQPLSQMNCGRLDFHLGGDDLHALTLYQWLAQHLDEIVLCLDEQRLALPPEVLSFPGFEPDDALLPTLDQQLEGYRLIQEYFYFPQRFHGFRIGGLRRLWPQTTATQIRLELHFSKPLPASVPINPDTLCLYCTPAINLFEHPAEPVQLDGQALHETVQPRGPNARAYEIFSIDGVSARRRKPQTPADNYRVDFAPYESLQQQVEPAGQRTARYFSHTIEPELLKPRAKHSVSLIHADQRPYLGEREVLHIALTCTNADLPRQLQVGDISLLTQTTPSFATYRNLTRPTRAYPPMFDGQVQWALISNLALNNLSLSSPAALKAVLQVYDFIAVHDLPHHRASQRRLEGILEVRTHPVDWLIKGLPVRGSCTTLTMDPTAFSNTGDLHLFGCVLSHFMTLYANTNAFHQLEIINAADGTAFTWPMRTGQQPII
ncbi:type VI secretion system baseplate subunit TssF [Pseudomonas reactans]|uniref:type VI secretion system baseplate subunit TssF n=1 Tax=Pseudomonas reactans TaxID=117680 RepID=UPI0015BE70F3|nr:type VI secretion system baseplate subunit TssF [Pseudomonas reactans]NWD83467.1 type VI secretion system baseplate subunit TssF [Pseudomonas reactans]